MEISSNYGSNIYSNIWINFKMCFSLRVGKNSGPGDQEPGPGDPGTHEYPTILGMFCTSQYSILVQVVLYGQFTFSPLQCLT